MQTINVYIDIIACETAQKKRLRIIKTGGHAVYLPIEDIQNIFSKTPKICHNIYEIKIEGKYTLTCVPAITVIQEIDEEQLDDEEVDNFLDILFKNIPEILRNVRITRPIPESKITTIKMYGKDVHVITVEEQKWVVARDIAGTHYYRELLNDLGVRKFKMPYKVKSGIAKKFLLCIPMEKAAQLHDRCKQKEQIQGKIQAQENPKENEMSITTTSIQEKKPWLMEMLLDAEPMDLKEMERILSSVGIPIKQIEDWILSKSINEMYKNGNIIVLVPERTGTHKIVLSRDTRAQFFQELIEEKFMVKEGM